MWPEVIVAAIGTAGASAAYLVHKARGYSGGYTEEEISRTNARRGTETPRWDSPDFNRYGEAPTYRTPGPVPSWYTVQPPAPSDIANQRRRQEEERAAGRNPYGWLNDPPASPAHDDDHDPPPYDGPRG